MCVHVRACVCVNGCVCVCVCVCVCARTELQCQETFLEHSLISSELQVKDNMAFSATITTSSLLLVHFSLNLRIFLCCKIYFITKQILQNLFSRDFTLAIFVVILQSFLILSTFLKLQSPEINLCTTQMFIFLKENL